ncbi:uncharacterized protein LOC129596520 [Paramacrobiotus metropolitanus]|uniref:uncharacterized protein LOC129596520 n=1 Tax=Paramacrobiotus metropolitanus TaxID=2943436 RepID=UPI002445D627|nr:uncharacterized protein LOC129596520 [Paramacrobiotus metropolitanus]
MEIDRGIFVILGLEFLHYISDAHAQYYNSYPDLESTCNQTLKMECPFLYTDKAGTLRYYFISNLPTGLCYFNVTLPPDCGMADDVFAFYINIRKFVLPTADSVRIYQTNHVAPRVLLKELTGSLYARPSPASVAQALTSYAKQPSFSLEYFRSTFNSTREHEAYIDFVVVEGRAHIMYTHCTALSGYVYNKLICDTDGTNERVNCPASFTPVVYTTNPAYSRQSCAPGAAAATDFNPNPGDGTQMASDDDSDITLSNTAIIGIVAGSVFLVVVLIAIVSVARRAIRRRSRERAEIAPPDDIELANMPGAAAETIQPLLRQPPPAYRERPPSGPPSYREIETSFMEGPPSYREHAPSFRGGPPLFRDPTIPFMEEPPPYSEVATPSAQVDTPLLQPPTQIEAAEAWNSSE